MCITSLDILHLTIEDRLTWALFNVITARNRKNLYFGVAYNGWPLWVLVDLYSNFQFCYISWHRANFAYFETCSRQNSNQILENDLWVPAKQTAFLKQFALRGVCVSSEKSSWTCFYSLTAGLSPRLNILRQTFHCFTSSQMFLRRPGR